MRKKPQIFHEIKVVHLQEKTQILPEIKVVNLWEKNSDIT